jgi:hypothetical protein
LMMVGRARGACSELGMTLKGPWWAKLRRAGAHIQEVKVKLYEFEQFKPWSVESGPGSEENEIAYRLRVRYPVPSDLVTIVGDAIHKHEIITGCCCVLSSHDNTSVDQ